MHTYLPAVSAGKGSRQEDSNRAGLSKCTDEQRQSVVITVCKNLELLMVTLWTLISDGQYIFDTLFPSSNPCLSTICAFDTIWEHEFRSFLSG